MGLDNNSSCVLLISDGNYKILLTGDIEKPAEEYLLSHEKIMLKANILVAPHHGSISSSSEEFVKAVQPNYVLFATGSDNRFHFPNPVVEARYREVNAILYNTVDTGSLSFKIDKDGVQSPHSYRSLHQHYWNH